ncbi:uncharacterized protein METZ01_LOCUS196693, partial [marine metagenome]
MQFNKESIMKLGFLTDYNQEIVKFA